MTLTRSLLIFVLSVVIFTLPCPAAAWGPHTEITAAALAVLPQRERLEKYFGDDWQRLAKDYCWTADWQQAVRPDHYADDYLLFPGMPAHLSHMLPEVRRTYEPYARRALRAVRTESPQNAARWIGSLLHFVQDSGSPPHTTGIGGELHSKMERWVDEAKIHIAGYQPKLLGKNDEEALRGFLERMERLVEFAKLRALKLKPLIEKLQVRANQPLELECALECARVTADVVHTLLTLGLAEPTKDGGTLHGKLNYRPPPGYATVPARVMLSGTTFATTTDAEGRFRFRNLPHGRYTVLILATGYEMEEIRDVTITATKPVELSPELRPDPVRGNLIRNPRFGLRWIRVNQPDWWTRDTHKQGRWASALIRVPLAQKCAVRVEFVRGKEVPIAVRWRGNPASVSDSRETPLNPQDKDGAGRLVAVVLPDPAVTPFEKGALFLEVLLHTDLLPSEVCRHAAVTFLADAKKQ